MGSSYLIRWPYTREGFNRASVSLIESLFDRFQAGDPIDKSNVSLLRYRELFDSLAAADFSLASRFAAKLGGRPADERKHDHPFTRAIGYALKYLTLGSESDARTALGLLEEQCGKKGNRQFTAYAVVIRGILDRDTTAITAGIDAALKSHAQLCRPGGMFWLTPDEVIDTWVLGLVNLAISRGLPAFVDHQYAPRLLVITA